MSCKSEGEAVKPIIFSTEMTRAITDSIKTQTRRVLKPQPVGKVERDSEGSFGDVSHGGVELIEPYCKPGDVLYVRETWGVGGEMIDGGIIYKADYHGKDSTPPFVGNKKWRSSIHMPRAAARIFLKVTDIRVERLLDMSEGDGIKEGFPKVLDPGANTGGNGGVFDWFHALWDKLHAKRPEFQWDKSPWVWVITFERIEKPEAKL